MIDFFLHLFDATEHPTSMRGGGLSGTVGWLHLSADLAIFFVYAVLCSLLMVFLFRNRDLPYRRTIWLIGLFMLAAGLTRLVGGVMLYFPAFRLLLVVKVVTAIIALVAVFAVARVFPILITTEPRSRRKSHQDAADRRRTEAEFVEQRDQLEQRATHLTVRDRRIRRALHSSLAAACSWDAESDEILWEVGLRELLGLPDETPETAQSWTRLLGTAGGERVRAAAQSGGTSDHERAFEVPGVCILGSDRTLAFRVRLESRSASGSCRSIMTGLVALAPPPPSA